MEISLSEEERAQLQAAQHACQGVRQWRRYQAVLLRADGMSLVAVAQALDCTPASVCNWTRAYGEHGVVGVAEGAHRGVARRFDATAEQVLHALLEEGDPQAHGYLATGWTVPLLHTELAKQGWPSSERTIRRTLHRLGYRWKRPKYVLGRPDPLSAAKKNRSPSTSPRHWKREGKSGLAMK